jgi:hypothetical protein
MSGGSPAMPRAVRAEGQSRLACRRRSARTGQAQRGVPAAPGLRCGRLHSSELNSSERLWLHLRDNDLTRRLFADTAQIILECGDAWNALPAETGRIRSLCSHPWLVKLNP